jgi:hypothetical protein
VAKQKLAASLRATVVGQFEAHFVRQNHGMRLSRFHPVAVRVLI